MAGARPLWEMSIAIAREVGDHVEAAHKSLALASITFLGEAAFRRAYNAGRRLPLSQAVALARRAGELCDTGSLRPRQKVTHDDDHA